MCPIVDSNSNCRHSCGVHYHEKLPMQVNSSYSFSSGPKKPWCSVLLLTIHRALSVLLRIAQHEKLTFPIQKVRGIFVNRHAYLVHSNDCW